MNTLEASGELMVTILASIAQQESASISQNVRSLICGKCGRTLKRYVKPDEALTDWRCRQRALVKKTDFHEDVPTRCNCRIVREVEAQRAVVMAFNTLPSRREELVVQRERLLTGEIGRIDALLKTLDGQQDRLEERLEVLASQVPEDEEPMNTTTVVDEVGSTQGNHQRDGRGGVSAKPDRGDQETQRRALRRAGGAGES